MSRRWLGELAPGLEGTPEELADRLASLGAPVDEVVRLDRDLDELVIGRVISVRAHPNADRLSLCEVDAGGDPVQVVCGAPNVREGACYPFAPVGASLPGGVRIRKARIRGEESRGMLCSARELELGRDHTGILELRGEFEPGQPFTAATGLDDVRFAVEVTPNRPDLLSHLGVARELAPGGESGLTLAAFPGGGGPIDERVELLRDESGASAGAVRVDVEDSGACPRYLAAVVRGLAVGPSPEWLASRLRSIGVRPINNVVDATNYVLQELGQPLHAFDLARLEGPAIRVRSARGGETIRTLDGEERHLAAGMLVIADSARPVAIAGVMGGEDSEVTSSTTDILLECALFDARAVRATSRALGLSTDASYRFERGVDPEGPERAARRALALITEVAGGGVEPVVVDIHPAPAPAPRVELRPARVRHLLGVEVPPEEIEELLGPLGLLVEERRPDRITFAIPGHRRADLEREVDLIEEVARRRGYDRFPDRLGAARPSAVPASPMPELEERVRTLLVGFGYLEARTAAFAPDYEGDVILRNPLSASEGRLRRSLLPGLLHRLEYNFARGARSIRLFEVGTAFTHGGDGEPPVETRRVAVALTGPVRPVHWSGPSRSYDLWDVKALLERLGELLGGGLSVLPAAETDGETTVLDASLAGGAGVIVAGSSFCLEADDGALVGAGGLVSEAAVDAPAWAGDIWGVEILISPVGSGGAERSMFRPLPAHPASERDLALGVPEGVAAAEVERVIRAAAGSLLASVTPFDVYRGSGIAEGVRSIAYRLRFQAPDRTLTDAEVDQAVGKVLGILQEELGVRRRG